MSGKYIKYLIGNVLDGSRNAFMEICEILHQDIFRLAFKFHPNVTHAKQLAVMVFKSAWRSLPKLKEETDYIEWLKKITIIVCFYHLKNEETEESSEVDQTLSLENLNDSERNYLQLNSRERFSLILFMQMNYSIEKISDLLVELSQKEIEELIGNSLACIVKGSSFAALKKISHDDWIELIYTTTRRGEFVEFNDTVETSFIHNEFIGLNDLIRNMFNTLVIPPDLLEEIRVWLIQESEEKIKKQKQKSKAPQKQKAASKAFAYKKLQNRAIEDAAMGKQPALGKQKSKVPSFHISSKFILVAGLFVAFAAIIIYTVFYHESSNTPWLVESGGNNYSVNYKVSNSDEINEGDVLSVGVGSRMIVTIPMMGELKVMPNSEVRLLKGKENESSIELVKGKVRFTSDISFSQIEEFTGENLFSIVADFGIVEIEYGDVEVLLTNDNVSITMLNGWGEFQCEGNLVYLAPGYKFSKSHNSKLFVPLRYDSSPNFAVALSIKNLYGKIIPDKDILINEARLVDALSLWHVIKYHGSSDNIMYWQKMNEFYPVLEMEYGTATPEINNEKMAFLLGLIKWEMILVSNP